MTVTDRSLKDAASRELGPWIGVAHPKTNGLSGATHPHDGGIWRGPTEAAWTTRLLHGAPPPREPFVHVAG